MEWVIEGEKNGWPVSFEDWFGPVWFSVVQVCRQDLFVCLAVIVLVSDWAPASAHTHSPCPVPLKPPSSLPLATSLPMATSLLYVHLLRWWWSQGSSLSWFRTYLTRKTEWW